MVVNNLIYVTLHWSGYGEEGTIGMHFANGGATDTDGLNAYLAQLNTDFGDDADPSIWDGLVSMLTPAQRWDNMRAYQYAVDGQPATAQGEHGVNHAGTSAANISALQQSICVTTLTGAPGRSNRGRMYFPGHCRTALETDGQLAQGITDEYAGIAASMVEQAQTTLQSQLGSNDWDYVVYSRARRAVRKVSEIRVDSRLDVQRRRAASQLPLRTSTQMGPA